MKRGREEIIARLLSLCSEGTTKTRLVYDANLNTKTIKPYLELLVKNGMVEIKEEQNDMYITTDKGEELLECFKKFQAQLTDKEDRK
jgi:predicted transcriptional regulator